MGNFSKGNQFNGGRENKRYEGKKSFEKPSFGGDKGFGRRRDDHIDMHKAICSNCGTHCEVPFRPTGARPVLCSDCFRNKGSDYERPTRNEGGKGYNERNSRPHFDEKPSYQKDNMRSIPNYNNQFEEVNKKLDRLLVLLESVSSEGSKKTDIVKEKKEEKDSEKEADGKPLKKTLPEMKNKKPVLEMADSKKKAAKTAPVKTEIVKKKTTAKKGE